MQTLEYFKQKTMGSNMLAMIIFLTLLFSLTCHAADYAFEKKPKQDLLKHIEQFETQLKADPDNVNILKSIGITYHALARENSKQFIPKSKEYLEKAFELNKKDYETMCFLGSATCMMAKTTINPVKRMSYANKGLALMDKAAARQPNNTSVLMTRAKTLEQLPAFFKRKKIAISDFEKVVTILNEDQDAGQDMKLKTVYPHLVNLYQDTGQQEKADLYIEKQKQM
nr:hypothetical protein [uncultured Desulfobacter sp.]